MSLTFDELCKHSKTKQKEMEVKKIRAPSITEIPVLTDEEARRLETLRVSEETAKAKSDYIRHIKAAIPRKYVRASVDNLPVPAHKEIPWGNIDGIYLPGNVSIGKTYAATALAKYALRPESPWWGGVKPVYDGKSLGWFSTPFLMARIRSTMSRLAIETEVNVIEEMSSYRVLVLDDLGAENITDFSASTVYSIISRRVNEAPDRLTIITSNQNESQIQDWEARVAARLDEFFKISLPDIDRRAQEARSA